MTKKLIIAEKPSVAADIAKALGGFTKHDDYFESEDFVLSSAVGHLLELSCPEEFEVKRGKFDTASDSTTVMEDLSLDEIVLAYLASRAAAAAE